MTNHSLLFNSFLKQQINSIVCSLLINLMSKSSRHFGQSRPISKPIFFEPNKTQSTTIIERQNSLLDQAGILYQQRKFREVISYLTLQDSQFYTKQAHYILAVSFMSLFQFEQALTHIDIILKMQGQSLKVKVVMLQVVCNRKLNRWQKSLDSIQKGLSQKLDAKQTLQFTLLKAKSLKKLHRFSESLQAYKQIQSLSRNSTFDKHQIQYADLVAYLFDMVQCYKALELQQDCMNILNIIFEKISQNDTQKYAKLSKLRIQCFLHFKKYQQLQNILQQQLAKPQQINIRADFLYYKGLVCSIRSNINRNQDEQQCVIRWNEALSIPNATPKLITKCLEQLSIYYMRNRDFYEALQYIMRKDFLLPSQKSRTKPMQKSNKNQKKAYIQSNSMAKKQQKKGSLTQLAKIAEGVTDLMKRKFNQAQKILQSVNLQQLSHLKSHHKFLKNLYYNALGFAYFSTGQHQKALLEYQKMQIKHLLSSQIINVDECQYEKIEQKQYNYNTNLCKGIIAAKIQKDENKAIEYFEACTDYLLRSQPYFYISVLLIRKSLNQISSTDVFMKVLNILDAGLKVGQNCHMFYYRALLYVYLGMNVQALEDVDRAIQKSEDNVAKYFFLRGVIFMLDHNYEQAASEMATSISIDDKFKDAYLQRAKCVLLLGQNIASAYMDLFEHPEHQKWKPIFDLYQKDFEHLEVDKIQNKNLKDIVNFHQYRFQQAGAAGKLVLAAKYNNFQQLIPLLDQAIQINLSVGAFQVEDVMMLKAYCLFKTDKLEEASKILYEIQDNLRNFQKSYDYSEQDQRKMLMIRVNQIFITLKQKKYEDTMNLTEELCQQVYQGQIYNKLRDFYGYLIKFEKDRILKITTINSQQFTEENPQQNLNKQFQLKLFEEFPTLSQFFQQEKLINITFKFLLPMPKLKLNQLHDPEYQKYLSEFGIDDVENKPQAPWIRRGQHGVLFTNDIQQFDNLSINTDQENRNRLKQSLQLGSDVLARLNKITKKQNS